MTLARCVLAAETCLRGRYEGLPLSLVWSESERDMGMVPQARMVFEETVEARA